MSPAIRNLQVASGTFTTTTGRNVYQVPTGNVFLLKSVIMQNNTGAAGQPILVMSDASTSASLNIVTASIGANQCMVWSGWTAMNANNYLFIYPVVASLYYWIAGALLPYAAGLSALSETTIPAEALQPLPGLSIPPEPIVGPPTIYLPPNENPVYVSAVGLESRAPKGRRAKRGRDS